MNPHVPGVAPVPPTSLLSDVGWGFLGRCPRCHAGRIFGRYLKVVPECSACGLPFHHHRADDFPPYIVMFVVGHLVGYGIYMSETRIDDTPLWVHAAIWPALTLVLSLGLLQPVKGAVVALQYGLGMHGFAGMRARPMREDEVERREGSGADGAGLGRQARTAVAEPDAEERRHAHRH